MPTLTKLLVEEGKSSFFGAGQVHNLPWISLFKHDDDEARKKVNSVDDIEEGWQIAMGNLSYGMNTSKIKEIVEKTDTSITFRTQTSLYRLDMEKPDDKYDQKAEQVFREYIHEETGF